MAELSVVLNELDLKALSYDCYDPQEWVDNCKVALKEKAAEAILNKIKSNKLKIVRDFIDGKITAEVEMRELPIGKSFVNYEDTTIDSIVDKSSFKTAKERQDEFINTQR